MAGRYVSGAADALARAPAPGSPAGGVGQPGLRRAARPAVPPRDDGERRRPGTALRALDRLVRSGPGLADLAGPLFVDLLVSPTGATEMGFGAASTVFGDGISSVPLD